MNERKLIVTRHAVEAYARRRHRRSRAQLEKEIREIVTKGLEKGLVFNHKPPGFLLYRRRNNALPAGQRFVYDREDSDLGFVLKRHTHGEDVVVTMLSRAGARDRD